MLESFFAMGGYGGYVWAAFGTSAVILVGLAMQSFRAARRREAELDQMRALVRPETKRAPKLRRGAPETATRAVEGGARE